MNIPSYAARALDALEAAGYESYVVGGCVRDSLLGRTPQDWDICTAARPEETQRVFAGARILETGLKHGTVTLLTDGGGLEITTFRQEGAYSDGRHPDTVEFVSSLRQDLSRRDFTVNAMAWSPRRGLSDPFGGQADLKKGLIRCVGVPEERFREDALRILRGLRFASRYGFTIEENTARALRECSGLLKNISAERIFSEFKGILLGKGAGEMLRTYPGVFFRFMPELAPMEGFDHLNPAAHLWDVWTHCTCTVDQTEPDILLRLAALFHDCGKPGCCRYDEATGRNRFFGHPGAGAELTRVVLERLRCDNRTRDTVCRLVAFHEMHTDGSRRAVRRLLSALGEEDMGRLLALRRADGMAHAPAARERILAQVDQDAALLEEISAEEGRLTLEKLAVKGRDLLSLGLSPGPAVGEVLRRLLTLVLDGEIQNDREVLLDRTRRILEEERL